MSKPTLPRRHRVRDLGTGAGILGAAFAPGASAATFNVTNLDDAGSGSLRQALIDANGVAGADTVTFDAALSGTITLTSGHLVISDSVDIQGPGAASLSVNGNNASRVFYLYNSASTIDVTISGLTMTGGSASIGAGLINFDENLTLDSVVISGNTATSNGGGLWIDGFNQTTVVRNSRITGNTAGDDGGGVYVEDTGGPMLFENTEFSGNQAAGQGGAVYLYDPDDPITFDRCTISGNTATVSGGGVYLYSFDDGALTLRDTTVSGNSSSGVGGGLALYDPDNGLQLEAVTVSGNTTTGGNGGGIWLYSLYAPASVARSTIAGNSAGTGSGGGVHVVNGTLVVDGSLVADNVGAGNADLGNDAGGFDARFSLIETPGTATITDSGGNVLNQDPQLGPLQDNGGPTLTHLPDVASAAVDAGDPAFAPPPAFDQRGFARVDAGRVDIGAVETQTSVFTLDAATYSVAENDGTLSVTVSRTPSMGAASVDLATSDGSATAGADYSALTQTLSFIDGEASRVINIPILDDALAEGNEMFTLALGNPGPGAALGAVTDATATIVDVEAGSFSFSAATYGVGEDAGSLLVTVTRSAGSTSAASVDYATTSGSAAAGSDFTATAGTLAFTPGQTSATFSVPIIDDAVLDPSESFNLSLSAPTNGATLGAVPAAVATITDNEAPAPGSIDLGASAVSVQESDGTVVIQVTRSGGSDGAISVDYATGDGSAVSPGDYGANSGTLTWPAGDSSPRTITITLVNDTLPEGPEGFTLTLSNPQGGAVLGAATSTLITIGASDAVSPAAIPTLGDAGRGLMVSLLALLAWLGLRRRGGAALLLLVGMGASIPTPADAAGVNRDATPPQFAVATVEAAEGDYVLRLADGSTQRLERATLRLRDRREGAARDARPSALETGQVVLFKRAGKGEDKIQVWRFDTRGDAEAALTRKQARRGR